MAPLHPCAAPKKPILNRVKKETLAQVFFCNVCKIFKKTFSYRTPLAKRAHLQHSLRLPGFIVSKNMISLYALFKIFPYCLRTPTLTHYSPVLPFYNP